MSDPALATFEKLFGPEFGHGRAFDLAPLHAALAALGAPQTKLPPVVHIAGTNGKGSTLAFLRAIAEAAGLKVHAYTKPHMLHLRERFRVAGALASDDALIAAAERVKATGADISQYEAQTAAAFLLFTQTPADLTLLETGFGGRDDASNVIPPPRVTLLAPIDLDHQAILGDTIALIAAHKAGIIKRGSIVISARQQQVAQAIIENAAERAGAPLLLCGRDWDAFARAGRLIVQTEDRLLDLDPPALFGPHQIDNAGLSAMAALALNDPRIDEAAIARGVAHVKWPGRLAPFTHGPLADRARAADCEVWVDGGHNPHAARALAAALKHLDARAPKPVTAIVALRARKDGAAFIAALAPALANVITLALEHDVSCDPAELAATAREQNVAAETAPSFENAIARALEARGRRILICGSLALAGRALESAGPLT